MTIKDTARTAAARPEQDRDRTQEQRNKELLLEAAAEDVPGAQLDLGRFYGPGYIRHGQERDYALTEFRAGLDELYRGFPDMHREVHDILVDGDRVAYRWEATGTHEGTYLGVRATHQPVRVSGMVLARLAEGRIVEEWGAWDKMALLHQLGIFPLGK